MGPCGEFRVLDLSVNGAMIEHGHQLTPGETRILSLRLAELDLRLEARVVGCNAQNSTGSKPGQEEIRFRSGLHFVHLPEGVDAHIRQYLATLSEPKSGPTRGLG